jgi:hypothetical protein
MSTYTMAAVEARKLAGEIVPMDASQAGEGKLAFTHAAADRRRRRDQPVQLPDSTSSRTRSPRARRGCAVVLKPASQTPLSALLPRRARARGRGSRRDGSSPRSARPSEIGDVLVEDPAQ